MHDDPTEHTCPHGSRPIDERCDTCWREENEDPIDFAMLTPPTRPGPCKAATAPEADPVEVQIERATEAAPFIAECRLRWERRVLKPAAALRVSAERSRATIERGEAMHRALEVKHGSGKVKV